MENEINLKKNANYGKNSNSKVILFKANDALGFNDLAE